MSTYANINIEGCEFHVRSDGGDWQTIRECVREYIAEISGVKIRKGVNYEKV